MVENWRDEKKRERGSGENGERGFFELRSGGGVKF